MEGLPSSTRESVIAFSSFRPLTPKIVWSESISVQLRPHNASMHEIKAFKNSVLQVCLYCREPSIANNQREDVAVLGRPEMIRLSDHRIGTAVVDLTTLSLGIDLLDGYYHIYDSAQRMIGQIRVSINYEIYQQRAVASSMKSTAASVKLLANESDRNLDLDLDSCSDFSSIDFLREKMKELDLIRAHLLNFSSNATVDTIGAKPTGSRQLASSPHNFMLDGESVGDNRQIGDDDDDREMVFNLNSSQRSSGNTLFSREDEDLAHPMHTIEMDYSNEFNEKDMYESDFESLSDEQSDSELFPDRQSPDLEINSEEFTIALNNNITDEEAEVNPDFEFKEIRIEMTDEVTKLSNVENSMTLSDNNNYNNFSDFQNDSLEHCSKPDAGREIEDEVGQRDGGTKEQYQDQVQLEIIECEPIADVSGNVSKENLEEEEEVENIYHGRSDCKESERMLEPCPQKVEKKDEVIDAIEDTKRMTGSEEEAKQTLVSLEDDSSLSVTSRQDINPKESFEQNTQQNSFNEIDHNANRIDESSLSTESAQSIESVRKLLREEMRKMLDEEGSYAHMKFGESSSEVSMAVRSSSSGSPGRAVEKAIQLSKFLPCSSPQDEIISASDIMSSPSFNISVYDFPLTKKSATIPTPVHSGMAKDSEDILRDSFSRIESHLPNISIDRGKQGRTSKEFPWKTIKNNFLDDETDRISKIMLGIFTREQVKR